MMNAKRLSSMVVGETGLPLESVLSLAEWEV